MRARIEDVAAAAGVSMKTVSRVFNREPNVREATRLKVEEAARTLNYRPNTSARSLAGGRSYLVSLLYDNPSSNYMMEIIEGVLAACEQGNYGLTLRPLDVRQSDHIEAVETLVSQNRPDGLILTPPLTDDQPLLRRLNDLGVRYSSISPKRGNARLGAILDERAAAADMVAHVVALGIAGSPTSPATAAMARVRGAWPATRTDCAAPASRSIRSWWSKASSRSSPASSAHAACWRWTNAPPRSSAPTTTPPAACSTKPLRAGWTSPGTCRCSGSTTARWPARSGRA